MRINLTKKDLVNQIFLQVGFSKNVAEIIIEDLDLDKQLLERINKFAPIKHILKNKTGNDQEII